MHTPSTRIRRLIGLCEVSLPSFLSFFFFCSFTSPPPSPSLERRATSQLQFAARIQRRDHLSYLRRASTAATCLARSLARSLAFVVISEARRQTLRAGRGLVNEQLSVSIAPTLLRRDELATIIQFRVACRTSGSCYRPAGKERDVIR